jgi:hypothetical protein
MNKLIFVGLLLLVSTPVMAQDEMDDGSRVILPLGAQNCDLPTAPAPIPEVPVYDDLINAQKGVKQFQTEMEVYRNCISNEVLSDELSEGNRQAITNAHNYSVEMEERVAGMFNEAVRAYKAAKAAEAEG